MVSSPNNHHDDEHTMKKAEMLIQKLQVEANRQKSVPPSIDGYSGGSYQSYHSPSPSPMRTTSTGSGTKKIFITNHCDDNSSLGDGEGVPPMTVSVTTDYSSSSSIGQNSPIPVKERRQQQQQLEALDSYQRAYTMAERSMTENSLDESALQAHVAEQTARRMQEEVIDHCCNSDDPGRHTINSRHQYDDDQESVVSTCVRTMWQCLQGGARGNASVTIPTDYFSNNRQPTAGGSGQYVPAYDFAAPQDEHSGLLGSPQPSGITRL